MKTDCLDVVTSFGVDCFVYYMASFQAMLQETLGGECSISSLNLFLKATLKSIKISIALTLGEKNVGLVFCLFVEMWKENVFKVLKLIWPA